jgi:integrase
VTRVLIDTGDILVNTAMHRAAGMEAFARFLEGQAGVTRVSDITREHVNEFIALRARSGNPPTPANKRVRHFAVRTLFNTATRLGLVDRDPTFGMPVPPSASPASPRPLLDGEIELLRAHATGDPRRSMCLALAEASALTSEIGVTTVAAIDAVAGTVRLDGSPRRTPRTVALSVWGLAQILVHLEDSPAAGDPLVPWRNEVSDGCQLASMALCELIRDAGLRADKTVKPASIPAWAGRCLHDSGAPLEDVARFLGSRSLDATAEIIGYDWRVVP